MDQPKRITEVLNKMYNSPDGTTGNHLNHDESNPLVPSLNFSTAFNYPNEDLLREYHAQKLINHRYLRDSSPLVLQLESLLASSTGLNHCVLFSSGMKAVWSTIWAIINKKTIIVTFGTFYRKALTNINDIIEKFDITHVNFESVEDLAQLENEDEVDLLFYIESPANPFLNIYDIQNIRNAFPKSKIIYDNTLAGLCNDQVNHVAADIIVTSLTKYIGGHNDLLGGAIFTSDGELFNKIWEVRSSQGGILDQMAAYLLFRSLKTYDVRMDAIQNNASSVLDFLDGHEAVKALYYPGRYQNIDEYSVFKKCYRRGMGMISFELHDEKNDELEQALSKLHSVKIAPSFGSTDSLIERPSVMSHFGKSEKELQDLGLSHTFIRFSVGMEPIEFILNDLKKLVS